MVRGLSLKYLMKKGVFITDSSKNRMPELKNEYVVIKIAGGLFTGNYRKTNFIVSDYSEDQNGKLLGYLDPLVDSMYSYIGHEYKPLEDYMETDNAESIETDNGIKN